MINKNHSSERKNINLVIGLGKSGFWAAKYLKSINKRVIVWESKDGIEFLERKKALEELNIGYAWFSFGIDEAVGTSSALFDHKGNLTTLGRFYQSVNNENPYGD